jgi:hypothetical protein
LPRGNEGGRSLDWVVPRAHSSAGRALGWQPRGQGFESPWVHHRRPHPAPRLGVRSASTTKITSSLMAARIRPSDTASAGAGGSRPMTSGCPEPPNALLPRNRAGLIDLHRAGRAKLRSGAPFFARPRSHGSGSHPLADLAQGVPSGSRHEIERHDPSALGAVREDVVHPRIGRAERPVGRDGRGQRRRSSCVDGDNIVDRRPSRNLWAVGATCAAGHPPSGGSPGLRSDASDSGPYGAR